MKQKTMRVEGSRLNEGQGSRYGGSHWGKEFRQRVFGMFSSLYTSLSAHTNIPSEFFWYLFAMWGWQERVAPLGKGPGVLRRIGLVHTEASD